MTLKSRPEIWGGITQGKLRKQRPWRWRNREGTQSLQKPRRNRDCGILGKKITGQFGVAGTSIMFQVWPSFRISLLVNNMTIFPVTQGVFLFASCSPINHHLSSESLANGLPPPQAHTTGHFATPWPGRRLPANWPKRVQQRPLDSRVPRAAECSTLLLLLVSQKSRLPCRQQIWKLFPENPTILGDKSDRYQKFTAP